MHVGLFTSTQAKCCCVSPPCLLSYHPWRFCVWGHCWGMMSSERKDYDATHLLASTVQDCVYHLVSSPDQLLYTQPHCSHWIHGGCISLFCCFLPPFRDRNQQSNRTSLFRWKRWCRMCFHLMPGYHHVVVDAVRVLLFWCLSHVCAEKKNTTWKRELWLYLLFRYIVW